MIDKIVRIDHSTGSLLNGKFCGVNCSLHEVKLKYGYLNVEFRVVNCSLHLIKIKCG